METSGKPEFLFNAMLMFGWVADKDSRITEVNVALESWLAKTDEGKYLVEEIKKGRGPLVEEFFRKIMDTSDDGSIEEFNTVTQHLRDIPESMALASLPESSRSEVRRVRVETEFIPTWDGEYLLIGVRAVRVGGFFLKGGNLKDRFDLIIVCQTKRAGGRWVVSGYQGQLQNAWLRVEPIVREGTRAGAVALMGRSLSHNIGSHALYWMEQDARKWSELGATTKPDFGDSLSTLFRYLRERMELIHGIAMKLPLSPQTVSLGDLVKGFNQNTELTNRLCRSEKVESVEAVLPEKDENQKVAIPGGRFGMQAFYCILENIARDCAKYGGSPRNMELQIDVEQPDAKRDEKRVFADGLLRVRVKDKRGPEISEEYQEEVKKKKEIVQNALNNLQIADYDGTLVDGYWGVKERFIAAALLRGIRVEDLDPFRPDDRPKSRTLLDASPPRIIDLVMDSETFEWEFYLLQAKEVLVIGSLDAVSTREGYESWKIGHEVEELDAKVAQAAAIRHRFVILEPKDQHELEWMLKNRECFPYRTFLAGDLVTDNQLTGGLARLNSQALLDWKSNPNDMKRQQNLKNDLARQWIRSLCKERNLDGRFILLMHNGDWFRVDWSKDSFTRLIGAKAKEVPSLAKDTENCLGVFHRHWPASLAKLYSEGQYMEIYSGDDSLVQLFESGESDQIQKYKLFESALVRILIIDERIDESAQAAVPDQHSPGEVNIWKRLAMKGIAVRGQEYSGQPSEYKGKLESWLEEANVHQYHFISIHRGILEKLEKNCSQPADQICAKLRKCTENLFVHSARSGLDGLVKNPEELGIRYIPLSNVSAWLDSRRSKWDVVDELSNIRRTA